MPKLPTTRERTIKLVSQHEETQLADEEFKSETRVYSRKNGEDDYILPLIPSPKPSWMVVSMRGRHWHSQNEGSYEGLLSSSQWDSCVQARDGLNIWRLGGQLKGYSSVTQAGDNENITRVLYVLISHSYILTGI